MSTEKKTFTIVIDENKIISYAGSLSEHAKKFVEAALQLLTLAGIIISGILTVTDIIDDLLRKIGDPRIVMTVKILMFAVLGILFVGLALKRSWPAYKELFEELTKTFRTLKSFSFSEQVLRGMGAIIKFLAKAGWEFIKNSFLLLLDVVMEGKTFLELFQQKESSLLPN